MPPLSPSVEHEAAELLDALKDTAFASFRPWATPEGNSPQHDFFRSAQSANVRIFRCGNQVGKTRSGCADAVGIALGCHPYALTRFPPPVHQLVSGLDWEFGIGSVIWPKMRDLIPMSLVSDITWMRSKEPQIPTFIKFKNGSTIIFKSGDSGRRKYQGITAHAVWLDEEHDPDIVEECQARLLKHGGLLTLTLTPIARMPYVTALERHPKTAIIRASMLDAARAGILDLEYVENYAASLPERQRRVRVFGDFIALEGMVYPEFSRTTHVASPGHHGLECESVVVAPWPLPLDWPRFAAIDWGYNVPTAILIAAQDPFTDRIIIERCYYASNTRASEWARLMQEGGRLPPLRMPPICDHDAQARAEFEAAGIHVVAANKDIDQGLEVAHRWIAGRCPDGAPQLVLAVTGETDQKLGRCDADRVAWELENYHYPPAKRDGAPDGRDLPVKRDDHAMDALRYLLVDLDRRGGYEVPSFAKPERRTIPTYGLSRPSGW